MPEPSKFHSMLTKCSTLTQSNKTNTDNFFVLYIIIVHSGVKNFTHHLTAEQSFFVAHLDDL